MYELKFDEKAVDFLSKLDKPIRKRIYDKIVSTKENPFFFFERLEGRKDFKLKVGDYRVIADLYKDSKLIFISHIGHRKNIYKKI